MTATRCAIVLAGAFLLLPQAGVAGSGTDLSGGPVVLAVRVECRERIDEPNVRRLIGLRAGDRWEAELRPQIEARLLATELFTSVEIVLRELPGGLEVVARLRRKPVIERVRFHGNSALRDERLRQVSRLQVGSPLSAEARDYAVQRIGETYAQEGFEQVRVDVSVLEIRPGDVEVAFTIDEGEPLRVRAIQLDGDLVLPVDRLRRALGVSEGDRLRRRLRREAERALEALLRRAGYYEVDAVTGWNPESGLLRFTINSGPVVAVVFRGNAAISSKKLLALVDIENRVVVTDGTWRQLARRIREAYQEKGYYRAQVSLRIDSGNDVKEVVFDVDEGPRFTLVPIEVEGCARVPIDVLRQAMLTGPPSWIPWRRGVLVDSVFHDDLKRLWFLYRRWGLLDAQITDYRIRPDAGSGRLQVTVMVEEGRQTLVREIVLRQFEALDFVMPPLLLAAGQPLNTAAMEADRENLERALQSSGYLDAKVVVTTDSTPQGDDDAAVVMFTAQAGPQVRLRRLIVQNNFDTQARVIRREIPLSEGDVLGLDALLEGQSNIYRLGLFRSVRVEPVEEVEGEEGGGAQRDVVVNVAERPPVNAQVGGGYNTRDGFRGFFEVAHNNLQGRGRRLSLRGDVALDPSQKTEPNEYLGNLGVREPRIFDSRWSLRADLIAQRATRSIDRFSIERFAFIPAIDRPLWRHVQMGLEVQIEDARIFDVPPDVVAFNPRDEGSLQTISLGPYLVHEGRDDPFSPTRGTFQSLRVRWAPRGLGSDIPFIKVQAHHSQYVTLTDWLAGLYAVRIGWARTVNSDEVVPLRERFFLGGRSTVRGFPENELGPLGAPIFDQFGNKVFPGGNPLGGDLAINLNAELRVPLLFGVSGVVFSDSGAVYLLDRSTPPEDFRFTMGPGLLYMTPVGPIALHYGFKLDRRTGESAGEVHFSIGAVF